MIDKLNRIFSRDFFMCSSLELAQKLLGTYLVKSDSNFVIAGEIIETEAYDQFGDEASHSFRGKTKRNDVMFRSGGYLYVYFTYGVHYCCNVSADKEGRGAAVLIRALMPLTGIDEMIKRRYSTDKVTEKQKANLVNGPAKICQAFNINMSNNGLDLLTENIYIARGNLDSIYSIKASQRIGISKSKDLLWRFTADV